VAEIDKDPNLRAEQREPNHRRELVAKTRSFSRAAVAAFVAGWRHLKLDDWQGLSGGT